MDPCTEDSIGLRTNDFLTDEFLEADGLMATTMNAPVCFENQHVEQQTVRNQLILVM